MPNSSSTAASIEIFVGRQHELAGLTAAYEGVCAGSGRLVLLGGAPGLGKTRLAEAWAAGIESGGGVVAWGRGDDGDGIPALWAWTQVLRACADHLRARGLPHPATSGATDFVQLIAAWSAFLGVMPAGTSPPALQDRLSLFDVVFRILSTVTAPRALVVIFDDLHCADQSSLLLLQFVARRLRQLPLLIVATHRTQAADDTPFGTILGELLAMPATEAMRIEGLSAADTRDYILRATGTTPSDDTVNAIWRRSDGAPLFVSSLVRLLLDQGPMDAVGAGTLTELPATVRAVVRRQLTPLSPLCRAFLEVAATLGRDFDLETVTSAAQLQDPSLNTERYGAALIEASRAGIINLNAHHAGHARFSHALVRDTIYDEIDLDSRRRLHRAVAQAFERLVHAAPTPLSDSEPITQIAFHFARAGTPDDCRKALQYNEQAARHAAQMLAYEEAARLYQAAIDLVETAAVDDLHRSRLLLALGEMHNVSSRRNAARSAYRQAAEGARTALRAGNDAAAEVLAQAAIGFAGGWAGVGDVAQFGGVPGTSFEPETVNLLEEARAALGEGMTATRACVLAQLAAQRHFVGTPMERAALTTEAVRLARVVGEAGTLGHVLSIAWVEDWSPDNAQARCSMADEIVACASQSGDHGLAIGGSMQRIAALLELGDAEALRRETARVEALVAAIRKPQWQWRIASHRILLALMEGRVRDAEGALDALQREPLHDDSTTRLFFSLQMTELQREQGNDAALSVGAAIVKSIIDQYPTVPSLRTRLAYLYAVLGRADEARAELAYVARHDFTDVPFDLTWVVAMAEAAETATAIADPVRSQRLYALLLPFADRHIVYLGGAVTWGALARVLGQLAATTEQWDAAAGHFEAALAANRRLGARLWTARTQQAYGAALLRRATPGDAEHARYLLEQAHHTATDLGLTALAQQAGAALQSVRGRLATPVTPTAQPTPSRGATAVFCRHGDAWRVVYEGRELHLRDNKGLRYLDTLLRDPGREFHVLDLAAETQPEEPELRNALRAGDGPLIDHSARAAYKARLAGLREELVEAESNHDLGRMEALRTEVEMLTQALLSAIRSDRYGRASAAAERARVAVGRRIRDVIHKLEREHPALGRHLAQCVKTGYVCVYLPEAQRPIEWVLTPPAVG